GPLRTFRRVVLPLSIDGILAGIVLTFAHTIGEFGVVLMVGGNLPGVTRTVSIAIYDDVQAFDFAAAHQTALLLLRFSFASLASGYALMRKPWAVAPVSWASTSVSARVCRRAFSSPSRSPPHPARPSSSAHQDPARRRCSGRSPAWRRPTRGGLRSTIVCCW